MKRKEYPQELKNRLNQLLPRFYLRVSSNKAFYKPCIAFSALWHVACISEGTYLLLPDAYGVLDYFKKYIDEEITIFQLWGEVKYILRYNGLKATVEAYNKLNIEIPKRVLPLLRQTLEGFMWDYPSQNVRETFMTHTGILQFMVMNIADFGFSGRLTASLFFYVNGKMTSQELLNEMDNIYMVFRGLKPGLKF